VADPIFWGSAIASVRIGEATTPHSHDEEETFVIMSGIGTISVDGETENVGAGDVVYLPRNSIHCISNDSEAEELVFLTLFWGSPEARNEMLHRLSSADQTGHLI
jgi:mannose-6-phosphate isomerase-like protein (cupin superfamily)